MDFNLADASAKREGANWTAIEDESVDDRFPYHAPVDAFAANHWGLQNMVGNVWEWCRDRFIDSQKEGPPRTPADGYRLGSNATGARVVRGGCFKEHTGMSRVSTRQPATRTERSDLIGVRPIRPLSAR